MPNGFEFVVYNSIRCLFTLMQWHNCQLNEVISLNDYLVRKVSPNYYIRLQGSSLPIRD